MQIPRTVRVVLLFSVLLSLLLVAANPMSEAAQEKVKRFTVENRSDQTVFVWMRGPAFHYVTVAANTTEIFTVTPGFFEYEMRACSAIIRSTIDLNSNQKIVVNECGDKGGPGTALPNITDTGEILRLVDVHLTNSGDETLLLIFTGPKDVPDTHPNQYVFRLTSGQTKRYTIPKGEYSYEMLWCDLDPYITGSLFAVFHKTESFACP